MNRRLLSAFALVALTASPALAHFPWVLNDKGVARIILSETLEMDYAVDGDLVSKVTLSLRGADGKSVPLKVHEVKKDWVVEVAGPGTVYGRLDLGLMKRGDTSHILVYFPKAIVGDPFGKEAQLVGAPVEFTLAGSKDAPRLQFLVDGKPKGEAELTLVLPDGKQKTAKTDANGLTEPLLQSGRYGAWARNWVKEPGERDGAAYQEVRRYATVVFDLGGAEKKASAAPAAVSTAWRLPEATSAFGAAVDDGWLYVYGGHILPTHDYSKAAVSGAFNRLNLSSGAWENLPGGSTVQGMNIAVHRGKVYRVGGMRPENEPGTPSDTRSLSEAARFDTATGKWESLPSLKAPRSSHEVVIVGEKLIVAGGWNMRGKEPAVWADTLEILDLASSAPQWRSLPQPFKRRALVAAVRGALVYLIGGFDENETVLSTVDIYDVAANSWSKGPALPKGARNGFSPAASTLDDRLYISLADGGVYRLDDASSAWEKVATTTARIAHRMIAAPSHRLLILGGAANGDNLDLIESVSPPAGPTARVSSNP